MDDPCTHAEGLAAWEKALADAKDKPPTDRYALQAAEFRESWESLWSDYFGRFEDTSESIHRHLQFRFLIFVQPFIDSYSLNVFLCLEQILIFFSS